MIFKVFRKQELQALFEQMAGSYSVIGPVTKARDRGERPIFAFEPVTRYEDLRLDYPTTTASAKRYFLPYEEDLATYSVDGKDWSKQLDFHIEKPRIFFGLHACDINALNKLDKVLLSRDYPVPHYAAKRKNSFVIGVNCTPQPQCFCRSMGADTVLQGFDVFLTDLGDKYFAEIHTCRAYNFLRKVDRKDPSDRDHARLREFFADRNSRFAAIVDRTDLTKILDIEFRSPMWKRWGDRCLSCGTCSNVCPTCYCFGVEHKADIRLEHARKTKRLYSCNLQDFAVVAGAHNFRPDRGSRLKYRFYHKHRGFVEAYEEPLCTGCGRCGEACLAKIAAPEVIASVRNAEAVVPPRMPRFSGVFPPLETRPLVLDGHDTSGGES